MKFSSFFDQGKALRTSGDPAVQHIDRVLRGQYHPDTSEEQLALDSLRSEHDQVVQAWQTAKTFVERFRGLLDVYMDEQPPADNTNDVGDIVEGSLGKFSRESDKAA